MKNVFSFAVIACLAVCARAEEHQKAAEIRAYLARNPIDARIPELMVEISWKSSDLNEKGYRAYSKKDYEEAVRCFQEAVEIDKDNSFAWYNLACTRSLIGGVGVGSMIEPLQRAARQDWYWGLQLMVDPDFDGWRSSRMDRTLYENGTHAPQCPAFIHVLRPNGTVTLQEWQNCAAPPRVIGTGYYCIVGYRLFEFFHEIGEYVTDGPNGLIHVPATKDRVRMPDFDFGK